MIKSQIHLKELVANSQRKTSAAKSYYPVLVFGMNGHVGIPALFSYKQIQVAMERAHLQPEDAPKIVYKDSFWERVKAIFNA